MLRLPSVGPDKTTEELFIKLKEGKTIELYNSILNLIRNRLENVSIGKT